MAAPPLPGQDAQEVVARVEQKLIEGYRPAGRPGNGPGAIAAAAQQAIDDGWIHSVQGFVSRLAIAKSRHGLEPDWTLYRAPRYQQPIAKLRLVPAPAPDARVIEPSGPIRRHLFIPDEHNDPRHPHRLQVQTWIARYGSDRRHDVVIKAGDSGTFDSVSRHDKDDTLKGRLKPPIKDDLSNHLASLQAFERGRAKDWKPIKKKAQGNHERRLYDFENANPASAQTHTLAYEEHLVQFGWSERPFGEVFYVDGIGYTHAPMNGMGKPMGGKTATQRAGAMLTAPLVYGHTHKFQIFNDAKIGLTDRITVIEGGCCLPYGEIEHYALHNPTGWSHGVVDLTVQAGQITDVAFVSLLTLRRLYSDDGADVAAA